MKKAYCLSNCLNIFDKYPFILKQDKSAIVQFSRNSHSLVEVIILPNKSEFNKKEAVSFLK